ncbi:PAAR domain-containing protein [Paracoccus caeni]|uniref:PAAR domain-containing protein n=1 Tax=Paracoccus caeni TaxID=657651 RepID=A0A934SH07_9RHOB|nr:PAAR domain-containing protein [Paracoccus caeni]MBK4215029.1 PAAR domain-containing protein [Paracoccus caeni]
MIVARVGDKHLCPQHGPNVIIEGGSATVQGRAVARVGDKCACGGVIVEGRPGALMDGRPVAYMGSKTSCGGVIVECSGSATFA